MKKFFIFCFAIAWLLEVCVNVIGISDVSREEFQNVTYTELMYNQDYQHYCVEYEEVKKEIKDFSEPQNSKIKENYRIMADKKDVVCFKYCDKFRIYPKEEFDEYLKVELCADEVGRLILKLIFWTVIYGFLGYFVYKMD